MFFELHSAPSLSLSSLLTMADASAGNPLAPGLLLGVALGVAFLGGHAAHFLHIPRVVGFILGGVALRAAVSIHGAAAAGDEHVGGLVEAASLLQPLKDLALGLILFTIGGVFERARLRALWQRVRTISLFEVAGVFLLVLLCTATALGIAGPVDSLGALGALAVLLAVAAIATAPAATLFVLQEYDAKGPVTDTILAVTAINNIACIVLFQFAFVLLASLGFIQTHGPLASNFWMAIFCASLGSVVLGILIGALLSILHAKLTIAEVLLCFFAIFIVLGAGEPWLLRRWGVSYNFLLTTLVIGGVFANVAIDSGKLWETLRTVGTPLYAAFFALAGFELHLGDLAGMGWLGLAYILGRVLGKWLGCRLGLLRSGGLERVRGVLGPALLCQAAVVIGLASFVGQFWDSPLADQFKTIVLGSVVVFELTGPLLVKRCAVQAGEVKAITLLRREVGASEETSIVKLTLQALARLVGWHVGGVSDDSSLLVTRHIMRTNVQFIRDSATFDEVLHQIERSTYNHFPVVHENGDFAGVIHFSDVRDVIYDPTLSGLVTALDLADASSRPVPMDMPLRELLDRFTEQNVAALPVVEQADSNRVVGLVEQRDLFRALHISKESRS